MKRVLGLLGLVVVLASSNASAQESTDDGRKPEGEPERRWYGYQTLAADGLAITLTGLGLQTTNHSPPSGTPSGPTTSEVLLYGGALTYVFAAPTVHALHGHWGKAGGSLAWRAVPLALGAALSTGGEGASDIGATVIILGIFTAVIADAAVIANETVPPAPKASVVPTLDPKSGAAGVAIAAVF